MLTKEEYHEMIIACRQDHLKFIDMTQSLIGGIIVDKLEDEFEVLFAFTEACASLQIFSYQDHFQLRILEKELATVELPTLDQWKTVERFGRTRYLLNTPGVSIKPKRVSIRPLGVFQVITGTTNELDPRHHHTSISKHARYSSRQAHAQNRTGVPPH